MGQAAGRWHPRARTARVLVDGETQDVAIERIRVGDTLVVRPGERIAVDGEVTQGRAHVDESMTTKNSAKIKAEIQIE